MAQTPDVSIVVVNSDGEADTLNCLASIRASRFDGSLEVVLVDNCSEKDPFPEVGRCFPEAVLLRAPQRQGFAKNYNLGMRYAAGDLVMILNNDTLLHPDALEALVGAMRGYPEYGAAGPRLMSGTGRPQPVSARREMTYTDFVLEQLVFDLGMPLGKLRAWFQGRQLMRRESGPVECLSGACILVRREALEAVGGLDERYDFYFEDIEWCRRFRRMGYEVGYISEAEVVHLGDRSLSGVRYWAKQSEFRGALLFFFEGGGRHRFRMALLKWAVMSGYLIRAVGFTFAGRFTSRRNQAAVYWKLLSWLGGASVVDLAASSAGAG